MTGTSVVCDTMSKSVVIGHHESHKSHTASSLGRRLRGRHVTLSLITPAVQEPRSTQCFYKAFVSSKKDGNNGLKCRARTLEALATSSRRLRGAQSHETTRQLLTR